MFKSLSYKFGHCYLILKVFKNIVPRHLYYRVFINSLKNSLHIYSPSSAILGLTYKCQCNCIHCSASIYQQNSKNELTTEEWFTLLDKIYDLGVPRINLSGGEALLRKDIFPIVQYAAKKFVVVLESNGQLLTEENIKHLKKASLSCVSVSIDSHNPAIHDKLRNLQGCFEKAVKGISIAVKNKLPCLMSTYVTSEKANREDIGNLMKLARRLGVLAVRILPYRPVGRFSDCAGSLPTREDKEKIFRYIDSRMGYFIGMPATNKCGIFSKASFYISPFGEVQPCPYLPLHFGNVRSKDLSEALSRMWQDPIFLGGSKECFVSNSEFCEKYINGNIRNNSAEFPIAV